MADDEITRRHRRAMSYTQRAFDARDRGDTNIASRHFKTAFKLERACAEEFLLRTEYEPMRSVLYRSAATLALDAGERDEARRLARVGLAGNPPGEIADELRDVLNMADADEKKQTSVTP